MSRYVSKASNIKSHQTMSGKLTVLRNAMCIGKFILIFEPGVTARLLLEQPYCVEAA